MDSSLLLAIIAAVAVFAVFLVYEQHARKRRQSQELTERIIADHPTFKMSEGDDGLKSLERTPSARALSLKQLLRITTPHVDTLVEKLTPLCSRAGVESPDAPIYYLFWQRFLSLFLVLLSLPLFLSDKEGLPYIANAIGGVLIIVIAVFGPYLWLKNKTDNRKKVLERSFPDALDLLLVCVESGLALDASFNRVCTELGRAHPVITGEFNRTRLELALLNDRSRALQNMAERTNLIPFRSLAAALIQTEKFGTSLTDTLRVLSDDYRQTRLLMAENKANRLPALITLPLITMLLPAFMLIILGPAIIRVIAQGGIFGNGG